MILRNREKVHRGERCGSVRPIGDRKHNAKRPPAAPSQGPEEVWMVVGIDDEEMSLRSDNRDFNDIVNA